MQPSPSQPRLFLVGHTRGFRSELARAFEEQDFAVSTHETAQLAEIALTLETPDAVLLDWMPGGKLTSLQFIERYAGQVPVLVLSRRDVLIDVVQAFHAGAADFIRLPCHFPEILARVERAHADAPTRRRLTLGNLTLDVESAVARIDGDSVRMTPREARMLAAMIRCPERAVGREALLRVAGIAGVKPTIVESYMKQLRRRHPLLRRSVRTCYGQGYAFFPER